MLTQADNIIFPRTEEVEFHFNSVQSNLGEIYYSCSNRRSPLTCKRRLSYWLVQLSHLRMSLKTIPRNKEESQTPSSNESWRSLQRKSQLLWDQLLPKRWEGEQTSSAVKILDNSVRQVPKNQDVLAPTSRRRNASSSHITTELRKILGN